MIPKFGVASGIEISFVAFGVVFWRDFFLYSTLIQTRHSPPHRHSFATEVRVGLCPVVLPPLPPLLSLPVQHSSL